MDKRKVIDAYRSGFLTVQECAQILGINSARVLDLMNDLNTSAHRMNRPLKASLAKGLRFP